MRSAVQRLRLSEFRAYEAADFACQGASVFLFGPNGAGKTNLLEALSLLSPGRGLRNAGLDEIGRRLPGEAVGRAWAVAVEIEVADAAYAVGIGVETPGATRRQARIDAAAAAPSDLARLVRPLWLTPAQDRLFLEAPAERRRFLDRLVLAAEPGHGATASAYERALRERGRLLAEEAPDLAWVAALEGRMAQSGARLAAARARTLSALNHEIAQRDGSAFPKARLSLTGVWEQHALEGRAEGEIAAALAAALAEGRSRDQAAGRALIGPHRGDLAVIHAGRERPAQQCSTGEQKALILNLILAQAARLSCDDSAPTPILLLDEVAAHLDPIRRGALFDEIVALGLQAFFTGTDVSLFDGLRGRALGVRVDASRLTLLDD
jgi:DNA replication and repair protein RecF